MAPLHPNLARIAARYDEILLEITSGRISVYQGRRKIETLCAKDDNGVEWSISAETGSWMYRAIDGKLIPADPPMWGMASATPRDFGSIQGGDPDVRINFIEVDESAQMGLRGSTRRLKIDTRSAAQIIVFATALLIGVVALAVLTLVL
jgi:hypothetical protein